MGDGKIAGFPPRLEGKFRELALLLQHPQPVVVFEKIPETAIFHLPAASFFAGDFSVFEGKTSGGKIDFCRNTSRFFRKTLAA